MKMGKAIAIFMLIDSDEFTDNEKAEAIYIVMNMPSQMGVNKTAMIKAIKWLWNKHYEIIEEAE